MSSPETQWTSSSLSLHLPQTKVHCRIVAFLSVFCQVWCPIFTLLIMLNVWRTWYCPVVWCIGSIFNPCIVPGHGDRYNPIPYARTFRNTYTPFKLTWMCNCTESLLQAACIDNKLYCCWIRYMENLYMLWLKLHLFNSGDKEDIRKGKIVLRMKWC